MNQSQNAWSVPLEVAAVPPDGQQLDISADAEVRGRIAKSLGLVALDRLQLQGRADRIGADGLRIVGTVSAAVTQTCVVTLDPVVNEVLEAVDVTFAPESPSNAADELVDAGVETPDPPEPLRAGRLDLATLAIEFLQLGLDPYPRRPEAVFEAPAEDDRAGGPFAALERLKNRDRS